MESDQEKNGGGAEETETLQTFYQKKEHVQHIYDLPDTYTGSVEFTESEMFVLNKDKTHFEMEIISYVPGLFKIFDEILVNALDHKQRDDGLRNIKVSFSEGKSEISVWNDGKGIDVERHPTYKSYIVEMLFGQLLTSSNYDKGQKRIVGGKNGYGAKLTNIFSKKFVVETVDAMRQKKYTQTFLDNMKVIKEPIVNKCTQKPYTCITFLPDYEKFGCTEGITKDIYKAFEKRVYDAAGTIGGEGAVSVFLNGARVPVKGFEKYVSLYFPESSKYFDVSQERWKVGVCVLPAGQQGFSQVSFVNSVWTMKGGKHVEHVTQQVVDKIKEGVGKHPKLRTAALKAAQIKEHLCIFVSSTIENPSFTSQTKEELSSKVSDFGSRYVVSDKLVERVLKSGCLVERLLQGSQQTAERSLKKTDGNKKSTVFVPKLEDANFAGTKKSNLCTLILTEGDSAKTSALSGLSVHGPSFRDYFGVFPLKGKLLNVRDASAAQIVNNEEIKNLKKILGLQQGKEYTPENLKDLRYGSVSLMTDQDSVTGDSPVLLAREDTKTGRLQTFIAYIQDLFDDGQCYKLENGKEISFLTEDQDNTTYVWTAKGYARIHKVIRHKTAKKIFRVVTSRGIVDVSEDHSLLDENENSLTPLELAREPGRKLLYSFPFEGSESDETGSDTISNDSKEDGSEIENGKEIFFYEFSKYQAQMRYLVEVIKGNRVHIDWTPEASCYCLRVGGAKRNKDSAVEEARIIDVSELYTDTYVYDLETENHQFQAGVGELILHNTDGSHIKGLVINFFDHFFPSLLRIDGFLKSYVTPIVRGFKRNHAEKDFYTLQDFASFRDSAEGEGYEFKYYKGLGTSSAREMQEYFRNIADITVRYDYDDGSRRDVELAFRKSLAAERKEWLRFYDPQDTIVYKRKAPSEEEKVLHGKPEGGPSVKKKKKKGAQEAIWTGMVEQPEEAPGDQENVTGQLKELLGGDTLRGIQLSVCDFVHKDLKHFSNADNIRSIPCLMDGLKPSQRKVIYGTIKKCGRGQGSVKVAQLSGYISEQTSYHHGEASLEQTIVSLAQKFVGKNNVNWLEPLGMFGTRLMGGRDHASSRYIFTRLAEMTPKTFTREDDCILTYQKEDNDLIEPVEYYPVVPVVLLNGCEGIGTGYSTFIPQFHPLQIVQECEKYARGELQDLTDDWTPWYDGFEGRIFQVKSSCASAESTGSVTLDSASAKSYLTVGKVTLQTAAAEFSETENVKVLQSVTLGKANKKQEKEPLPQYLNKGLNTLVVTELPVGMWTDSFKEFIEEQIVAYREWMEEQKPGPSPKEKEQARTQPRAPITAYVNRSTELRVYFEIVYDPHGVENKGATVEPPETFVRDLTEAGGYTPNEIGWIYRLKLYSKLKLSNMHLYVGGELRKFDRVSDILQEFGKRRLERYAQRREFILQDLRQSRKYVHEKCRFLEGVIGGKILVFRRPKEHFWQDLAALGFGQRDGSYDYLTKMSIEAFTHEKMDLLSKQEREMTENIEKLEQCSAADMWLSELDEWRKAFVSLLK